jgi:hypothetical protein
MDLKPIETVYRGWRFRSRLEARWAVFLETCGLTFDYEPEGFDLDGLWYLPDFWVHPQMETFKDEAWEAIGGFWLEVKGQEIKEGDEAWRKAQALAEASDAHVVVFWGQIKAPLQWGLRFAPSIFDGDPPPAPVRVSWNECPWCGRVQPSHGFDDMDCMCAAHVSGTGKPRAATYRAMQARFERGRRGR